MNEFTNKIDRLIERVHRNIKQCDHIEQRTCIVEEHLMKLNESIQTFARLMEVSYLLLNSSNKDKQIWLQINNDENHPDIEQFIYRLECYLRRDMADENERQSYIQALFLLQSNLIV